MSSLGTSNNNDPNPSEDLQYILPFHQEHDGGLAEAIQIIENASSNPLLVLEIFRNHQALSNALQFDELQSSLMGNIAGKLIEADRILQERAKKDKLRTGSSQDTRQISLKFSKALREGCKLAASLFQDIVDNVGNEFEMAQIKMKIDTDLDQVVNLMDPSVDVSEAARVYDTTSYSRALLEEGLKNGAKPEEMRVDADLNLSKSAADEKGASDVRKKLEEAGEESLEEQKDEDEGGIFGMFDVDEEELKEELAREAAGEKNVFDMEAALEGMFGPENKRRSEMETTNYPDQSVPRSGESNEGEEEIVGYLPGEIAYSRSDWVDGEPDITIDPDLQSPMIRGLKDKGQDFTMFEGPSEKVPEAVKEDDIMEKALDDFFRKEDEKKAAKLAAQGKKDNEIITVDHPPVPVAMEESAEVAPEVTPEREEVDDDSKEELIAINRKPISFRPLAYLLLLALVLVPRPALESGPLDQDATSQKNSSTASPKVKLRTLSEEEQQFLRNTVLHGRTPEEVSAAIDQCRALLGVHPDAESYLREWESMASNATLVKTIMSRADYPELRTERLEPLLNELKVHGYTLAQIDEAIRSCDELNKHHHSESYRERWVELREKWIKERSKILRFSQ